MVLLYLIYLLFWWWFSSSQTVSLPEGSFHPSCGMMIIPNWPQNWCLDTTKQRCLWLKSAEHPKFSNQMQERIKRDPAKKSMNKHEQTDNQLNVVRECLGNWWYLHQMVVLSLDANNIPRFSSSDNLRSPTTSRTSPYLLTLHWSHTDVVLLGGWVNPQRCHQTWRAAKKSSSRMQVFTRKSIINEGFNGDIIYKWWIR